MRERGWMVGTLRFAHPTIHPGYARFLHVIASGSEAIHLTAETKEWIASSLPLLAMTAL
jgi:hypothetical protein